MITVLKQAYYRLVQAFLYGLSLVIRIRQPQVYEGTKILNRVADILNYHQINKVLVVTDKNITKLKLYAPLLTVLQQQNMDLVLYDDVDINPTIENFEAAKTLYKRHQLQAIIGFGGGSSLDCAKGAAALIASQKKVPQLKGLLKVRKKPPLMIMIPTTTGTGSEATVAVVVSNPKTKEKYAISDPVLVPDYAILDANLVRGLPAMITAYTGMDALTHAIEAFLGRATTAFTRQQSLEAITLIHQHLYQSVITPDDLISRAAMLKASYQAGLAFTRSYVGYVHAIAHTLGGFYNYPHGLANAIILPYVLEMYGKAIHPRLAMISDALRLMDSQSPNVLKAKAVLQWIRELSRAINLPVTIDGVIKEADIPLMVKRAKQEAHPIYPVPVFFSDRTLVTLYNMIQGRTL
jgi:alcohol dehydrogenase class IV